MAVNSTHASLSCFCSHLQLDTRCMHAHVPVRGAVPITSGMLGGDLRFKPHAGKVGHSEPIHESTAMFII